MSFVPNQKKDVHMLSGESTFTARSITRDLEREGIIHGTPEFSEEVRRRFVPTDATNERGCTLYVENPDYKPGETART